MEGDTAEPCAAGSSRVQKLIAEFQSTQQPDDAVRRDSATMLDMPTQACDESECSSNSSGGRRYGIFNDNRILYDKISPSNRFWLRLYLVVSNLGVTLLIIAYSFYIIGLFEPILYLDAGDFTDPDIFEPFYETLPHSLITLYNQRAYFTVVIAGLFSITLPFVKMIVTSLAYFTAVNHRRTQLRLFFGEKPIDKSGIGNEDDGNIKYAREMLIILKLVSKFQMVDVVILLLNAVFLRCAFLWARPGKGLLYLIIYCLLSIAGAQMVNFAVEGEKDIFDSWYAIKYAIVPQKISIQSASSTRQDKGSLKEDTTPSHTKRWFISEDFICLMAGLNILSCISLMTNEKLLTVSFTMDVRKVLALDSTSMSYPEVIQNLRTMDYGHICIVILFFLCILFPMAFSLLFLASIFGYNYCKRNNPESRKYVEIANSNDEEPYLDYDWDVKYTCFVFKLCNIVSEWSCGEVVSLATMAAFTSMTTAERVIVTIPPKNTCSALFMMGAFGISSFLLVAMFYIWNQNVKSEFSHIRIYVKYLESPNQSYMARLMSDHQFTDESRQPFNNRPPQSIVDDPESQEIQRPHRKFFVPYLEGIRGVLYSKWLSSLFFGLLTAFTILFTMSAYTYSYPTPYLTQDSVNTFLQNDVYEVFNLVMKQVPQSIGHCNYDAHPPALPCAGAAPLFETKNSLYAGVIWFSGFKTISLNKAEYTVLPDKRMSFKIRLHIGELQAYLRLAAVADETLVNILQGVIRTLGDNFYLEMDISMQCVNRRPQIRDLRVDRTQLENFRALDSVYEMLNQFMDVSTAISNVITLKLNELLRDRRQRILWRGISFDVMEMVNLIVVKNWPSNFVCPQVEA